MIAIHTKFIPATDTRGARIKAYSCNGHALTIPFDYGLGEIERHAAAVKALLESGQFAHITDFEKMAYGGSADDKGYTFCFLDSIIAVK